MDATSIRARSIGEILDGAFRLYRQDLGLYVLTAVLAAMPLAIYMLLTVGGANPVASGALGLVVGAVSMLASLLVWAALMHQMNERLNGREPALGPSIARALKLFLRVLWGAILSYIILIGAGLVIALVAAIVVTVGGRFLGEIATFVVTGIVVVALGVTLGLRVLAGVTIFLPGIIAENLTGYGSVKRGLSLAKEGRGRIVSVILFAWVLVFVPLVGIYFLTGTASMLTDPAGASSGTIGMGQLAVQQLLVMAFSGFTTPFFVSCILLLHYDQRVRLEAYDLEAEVDALAD